MKKQLSSSLEVAVSKSNIDLCASRVHMVLLAAYKDGKLDSAIETMENAINSVVSTITDEQSE